MAACLPTPCDTAVTPSSGEVTTRHPNWTLAACILASSLAFLDGSVVNVALPAIAHDLRAGAADLQWTINAYLLPLSALLLIGGAAGDHFGRRRMMIGGIVVFALASLGCAVAPTLAVLLPLRAVQGVGAAMLMPNSLAILGNAFAGEAKGRAIGSWAAVGAIASAVGPPLGGWLVQAVGWRAIFYVNVPVAVAATVVAWRFVDESAEDPQPLDWSGAASATLALAGTTWALTAWSSAAAMPLSGWAALAIGIAALAAFLMIERRRGDGAMMPLSLFASRPFVGLTLLTFLLYGALGGLLVLLPYVLIQAGGYSPLQAGTALLPFPIVIGLGSRLMGQLTARVGPRLPLSIGPAITAIGLLLLLRIGVDAAYWHDVLPAMLVIAVGMAGAVAPLTTAVLVGAVIAQRGGALIAAFHGAAVAGAIAAMAGAVAAFATLDSLASDE